MDNNPTSNIKNFISNIVDKNYSYANSTLQKMIEDKMKNRIQTSLYQKKPEDLDK